MPFDFTAAQKQTAIIGALVLGAVGVAYAWSKSGGGQVQTAGSPVPVLGGSTGGSGVAGISPAITYNLDGLENSPYVAPEIPPIPPLTINAPDNRGLQELLGKLAGASAPSGGCCSQTQSAPYVSPQQYLAPPVPTSNVPVSMPQAYPRGTTIIASAPMPAVHVPAVAEWRASGFYDASGRYY